MSYAVRHPCSDFMDMLRRLINSHIIIIIILLLRFQHVCYNIGDKQYEPYSSTLPQHLAQGYPV